jgi:CheY-like chemotaxis protein
MDILLVEDNPTDRKLVSAVLTSCGHDVLENSTAEQAVEAIKARHPEVIVLDLKLPGMNGLALARRLKQDPHTRHIPIIAVTAAIEIFAREEALAAGCDAFLVKPVNTRTLPDQVVSTSSQRAETGLRRRARP